MATHSSILAWKIPWTEEPVYIQEIWFRSWVAGLKYFLEEGGVEIN